MRLQRQVQGALRISFLGGLSLRGEQNGAAAVSLCALYMSVLASDSDGFQGAGPIAFAALQVEQCVDRPGEFRVEGDGAFGEMTRGLGLALALRFEKEATQAELLGVGRGQHGFENAAGGGAVASELGGLRP